jgi:hypothetical protein
MFAKVLSYAMNAYLDAQICEEIVTYIRTRDTSFATTETVAQQRAEQLVANAGNYAHNPSYLIGLAYTEYYGNGLADILYPKLLWPLIVSAHKPQLRELYKASTERFCAQHLTTAWRYEEFIHKPSTAITYWPRIIANPWRWVDAFAKQRCNYAGPLDQTALLAASRSVQHHNSRNNYEVANTLRTNQPSSDPKVVELREVAPQLRYPTQFLEHAAATQIAASRWDALFDRILSR